jgi:hypothetical protein
VGVLIALVLAAQLSHAGPVAPPPNTQALLYFNARLALREDNPSDAVKLWLLRNTVEHSTQRVSTHNGDFESVTWVAMSNMGLCPVGLSRDNDGAGLWPIALHNWVVRTGNPRRPPAHANPWQSFERGQQSRRVSIDGVLSGEELRTLELQTGGCSSDRTVRQLAKAGRFTDTSQPHVRLEALTQALGMAQQTLSPNVRGTAVIDARLFDLHLARIELATGGEAFATDSAPSRILHESITWPASEWMALSPDRRRFLFDYAREHTRDNTVLDALAMDILSAIILDGTGEEVGPWIARCGSQLDRQQVWGSTLGELLQAMEPQSGFRERSALALHRGVWAVQVGDHDDAVRSFALALHHAEDSAYTEEVHALALRWLSYVATQFEITDALLDTLHLHVTSREADHLLDDLIWAAALRADARSFERGMDDLSTHGSVRRRLTPLTPLASGDSDGLLSGLQTQLATSPRDTLRFVTQFVEHLELEDTEVRAAQANATLPAVYDLLQSLADGGFGARHMRGATALQRRVQAIIRGVGAETEARTAGPSPITYAGSVRLAPADPIPWPFHAVEASAPSALTPLVSRPREWRDANASAFGWELSA